MGEFKVGGKCVALVNGKSTNVRKGEIFPINGIRKSTCGCLLLLDIGLNAPTPISICHECKYEFPNGGIRWLTAQEFAPLDELESQKAIDELLDRILESEKEKV